VSHSRRNATLFGAAGGATIALAALALFVGRVGLHTPALIDGDPVVQVTSGALYLLVLVLSVLAGLLIGAIGYGIGVAADPDAPRFALGHLLPVSAVTAAVVAYAVLRIGIGGFGEITAGTVTIGALRLTVTVLVMGAASGGITAGVSDALARPALFGFGGEAWPASSRDLVRAMLGAVSAPLVAAVIAAGFAIPLSLVLIEIEGDAATVVFSVVGAVILAGTAFVAARPWDRGAPR
jgi:hypothetical protein